MKMEIRIPKKIVCELDIVIDKNLIQEAIEFLKRKLVDNPNDLPDIAEVLYTLHHEYNIVYPVNIRRDAKFKLLEKLLSVDAVSVVEYALYLYLKHILDKQRSLAKH